MTIRFALFGGIFFFMTLALDEVANLAHRDVTQTSLLCLRSFESMALSFLAKLHGQLKARSRGPLDVIRSPHPAGTRVVDR
jgi:hypothetical protein